MYPEFPIFSLSIGIACKSYIEGYAPILLKLCFFECLGVLFSEVSLLLPLVSALDDKLALT
jgi:hypothetical protein